MSFASKPIIIATRGSALALAQANLVFDQCRAAFPKLKFEIKIIKTTGDKLQTASLANPSESLPKGLFTRELEVALLKSRADLAVHSLKDLPTELPAGLRLGAVSKRVDVRDALIYRDAEYRGAEEAKTAVTRRMSEPSQRHGSKPNISLRDLPQGATIATSSTRRKAQLLANRPDLNVVEIRGNVVTRLQKLDGQEEIDAVVLAAAGLERLSFRITSEGRLQGDAVPDGLLATVLEPEIMLPCVGQGALGIEIRENDERVAVICERLDHFNTRQCVAAERAFLGAMGGGCQSPIAAYAEVVGDQVRLRVVSFQGGTPRRGEAKRGLKEPTALGEELAAALRE
ncbi:MAG: hydroxymethylbilane synthase [Verrucomicrobia bacterium]|nr:MAG: hydroxymethylbilane synthase [Verrucomicrobiota bacterium]